VIAERAARWLVATFLTFAVAAGARIEPVMDDQQAVTRASALGQAVDPGWATLDDPAVDDSTGDIEKAGLPPTVTLGLATSIFGALLMRATRYLASNGSGASPTRGPPRVPADRPNSLPIASPRPSQRSIKGRGPPARRLSNRVPRVLLNRPIIHTGGTLMRLLSVAIATALVGVCGAPALASECPLLQRQMDRLVGNRVDAASYQAKELMKEAAALHKDGKHAESVAKYDEAAKVIGVSLEHKK
jgi:hypothetical protein